MIPMINVVFLLLIFFMLLASASVYVPFPVTPPDATTADSTKTDVMIAVAADGRIALDGSEIDASSITPRLRARLAGRTMPPIWLNADRDADADRVIDVMEHMRRAGVTDVRLITNR